MVFSYYFIRFPYVFFWKLLKLFRSKKTFILYCEDPLDAILFRTVQQHLKPVPVVAKNRRVQKKLRELGFKSKLPPVFPDVLIMFRNAAWKFPCKDIVKIGFDHGAYNFKRFPKAYYYNMFDLYFMSSSADIARANARGIRTVKAVGFPKIDPAFDGSITQDQLDILAHDIGLLPTKKTLLFSATWDGSSMSAIHLWYNRIAELKDQYNIMVTLHSAMSESYCTALQNTQGIYYIRDYEILRYIMLADVCIGDTNSLLAEFCMLNKPIITFRVPKTPRTMADVIELIESISVRIDNFDQVVPAVEEILKNPAQYLERHKKTLTTLIDSPDGKAGFRAAQEIIRLVPELRPDVG